MTESSTVIVTPPCTGYFIAAVEPKPNLQNELKYSAQIILDKKEHEEGIKQTQRAISACAEEALSNGTFPKAAKKSYLQPLRDGDVEIASPAINRGPEYEGKMFFNANSNKAPGVIRKNGTDIIDDDECYSGALYRFQVNFYPSTKGAPRVCAGLSNVMKVGEGKRMDGREAPNKAFADHIESGPDGAVDNDDELAF